MEGTGSTENKEEQQPVEEKKVADKNQVRWIKIKSGTLKRNMKDFTSYKKEEDQLRGKLEKMMDEGKDEHDCNKMKEQITETSETLVQCKPRIENAIDDLENCMATYEEGNQDQFAALKETPEW